MICKLYILIYLYADYIRLVCMMLKVDCPNQLSVSGCKIKTNIMSHLSSLYITCSTHIQQNLFCFFFLQTLLTNLFMHVKAEADKTDNEKTEEEERAKPAGSVVSRAGMPISPSLVDETLE